MTNREQHIDYLHLKLRDLNAQYLRELMDGKSLLLMKELATVISTLTSEIREMEQEKLQTATV